MKNDVAYQNAEFIPNADAYLEKWEQAAREHREVEAAIGRARLNEPYGAHERERYDLFHPAGPASGLMVFVHGGYWRRFDKSWWSQFAAGGTGRGYCVAMPSYPLAPEVRITDILTSTCRAIEAAAQRVAGPIALAGHSAGGQLVAMAMTEGSPLDDDVRGRVGKVLSISPVSDLRPLLETTMNEDFCLDDAETVAMSPALKPEPKGVDVTVWVGAEERPAFLDQARWLAEAWPNTTHHIAPGRHHFDVIDPLADADSDLIRAVLA